MRALILSALPLALSLSLAACNQGDTAQGSAEAERNVTSEVTPTNDTTAIDAATGEAAAMAADVDFMPEDLNAAGNEAAPAASRSRAGSNPGPGRRPAPEPRPANPDADTGDE